MPSKFTTFLTSILALLSLETFIATSPNQSMLTKSTIKYQLLEPVSPDRIEGSGTQIMENSPCPGSQKSLLSPNFSPTKHISQTSLACLPLYAYFTEDQALETRLRELGKFGTPRAVWTQSVQPKLQDLKLSI